MLLKGDEMGETEARIPELIESASESEDSTAELSVKKKKKKRRKKKKKGSFVGSLVDQFEEELSQNAAREEEVNQMLIRKFSDPRLGNTTAVPTLYPLSPENPPREGGKGYPSSDLLSSSILPALSSHNEARGELIPPPLELLAVEGATILGIHIQRQKGRSRLYTEACETLTFLSSELGVVALCRTYVIVE